MIEVARLRHGELEHLLGAARVAHVAALLVGLGAELDDLLKTPTHVVEAHVERFDHRRRDARTFAQKREEKMLGLDVGVPQPDCFFAGVRERGAHTLREMISVHQPALSGLATRHAAGGASAGGSGGSASVLARSPA